VSQKASPTFSTVTWKPITYQILIFFGTNIPDKTCHQMKTCHQLENQLHIKFWYFLVRIFLTKLAIKWPFSFSPHPTFDFALPGEKTTSEISLFYSLQYNCLINITRKTFCSHFWHFGRHFIQLSIFNCLQQNCLKCWLTMRTQARRRFLHSLTAVSTMFCSKPILAVPVPSRLHKHF